MLDGEVAERSISEQKGCARTEPIPASAPAAPAAIREEDDKHRYRTRYSKLFIEVWRYLKYDRKNRKSFYML